MSKLKDRFKPLNIISLNAYEIVFYEIIGAPFSKEPLYRYDGTTPMSLDLLKTIELCEELEDNKGLVPYKSYSTAALKSTEAVINVSFGKMTIEEIGHLSFPLTIEAEDAELVSKYSVFVKWFYLNRDNYGIKYEDAAIKKLIKDNKKLLEKLREDVIDRYTEDDEADVDAEETDDDVDAEEIYDEADVDADEINDDAEAAEQTDTKKEIDKDELESGLRKALINKVRHHFCSVVEHYLWGSETIREIKKEKGLDEKQQLRYYLYKKGFDVSFKETLRHYRFYKRSASKAKKGNTTFIFDGLYEKMMDWTRLGLKVEEGKNCDITSMKAYEALTMSSTIGTIRIPRDSILLLDSVESLVSASGNRRIFTIKNDAPVLVDDAGYEELTGEKYTNDKNKLWDGQALVDESIFDAAGYSKKKKNPHAMMLLRNHFFKACAFNTKIQKYYKKYFEDKEDKTVVDMFGRRIPAEKIKMIVTVDSFKLDKFAEYFMEQLGAENKDDAREKLYLHWLEHIGEDFGIVKEENPSHLGHGKYHSISYQILNTLPIGQDDMRKVISDDRNYISKLGDTEDVSLMYHHLRNIDSSARKKYFISTMLRYSPDFKNSYYYKSFRSVEISEYKAKMKTGKVKVRGDFYVLCSMPMEMLEYSAHNDVNQIKPYLEGDNAYIKGMKKGEDIILCRYPHMNSGSVCALIQAGNKTYDTGRYFNLEHNTGSNVVIVSPWNSNILCKLGGADFDSDTAFCIKDETIKEAAIKLNSLTFLDPGEDGLPVAVADEKLKGTPKLAPLDNVLANTILDHDLAKSSMTIGRISNTAQLFNSYFWDEFFRNGDEKDEGYLKVIYNNVLILSILNELEIDRSKRNIRFLPEKFRKMILHSTYNGACIIKQDEDGREYYPYFLWLDSSSRRGKTLTEEKYWNTPVDFIARILGEDAYTEDTETVYDIEGYFDLELKNGRNQNTRLIQNLRNRISDTVDAYIEINKDKEMNDAEKEEKRRLCRARFWNYLSMGSITSEVMKELIRSVFERYKMDYKNDQGEVTHKKGEFIYPKLASSNRRFITLGIIFEAGDYISKRLKKENPVIACIKGHDQRYMHLLVQDPDREPENVGEDEVVIWGDVYKRVKE